MKSKLGIANMSHESTEPTLLTQEQVDARVKATMMAQQSQLLELAAKNALKLVQEENKKATNSILELIDTEVEKSRAGDAHVWSNNINKSNYDAIQQVERMWTRTERMVGVLQVPEEQKELKDAALKFINEGKRLPHERLKVFRFADRDGWSAALNFLADDIAENEKDEKRMKKGKKEAEASKSSRETKRTSSGSGYSSHSQRSKPYSTSSAPSSSGSNRSRFEDGRGNRDRSDLLRDGPECYICGKSGHISKFCYQRHRR